MSFHEQKFKPANIALRAENERILKENMEMKERLKNLFCQSCNDSNNNNNIKLLIAFSLNHTTPSIPQIQPNSFQM